MVAGNGRRLAVAAPLADAIGFIGVSQSDSDELRPTHITFDGLREQVAYVRDIAGDRFAELELSILVQQVTITDNRMAAVEEVQSWLPASTEDLLNSPYFLHGSARTIAERLDHLPSELGITYVTVLGTSMAQMERVMEFLR